MIGAVRRGALETAVGLFVVVGVACLAWLSVRLGRVGPVGGHGYEVRAEFGSAGGLRAGATVEIAGVPVGRVARLSLEHFRAVVTLRVDPQVELPDDSIVSIRTKGLVGDKFVSISPGASTKTVGSGGRLRDTEDSVDFEQLISQYIHGKL
jgi:phospholipid/cholesterol/gamma-HCH transport system substrate-binding protein